VRRQKGVAALSGAKRNNRGAERNGRILKDPIKEITYRRDGLGHT